MSHDIQTGVSALVMHARDHVATALQDLRAGEQAVCGTGSGTIVVALKQDVPFGHKFAIADIPEGTEVRKYGEVIGRSSAPIAAGEHVHVHNLEGIRGRGDKPGKEH